MFLKLEQSWGSPFFSNNLTMLVLSSSQNILCTSDVKDSSKRWHGGGEKMNVWPVQGRRIFGFRDPITQANSFRSIGARKKESWRDNMTLHGGGCLFVTSGGLYLKRKCWIALLFLKDHLSNSNSPMIANYYIFYIIFCYIFVWLMIFYNGFVRLLESMIMSAMVWDLLVIRFI